jgi:predicted ATPase
MGLSSEMRRLQNKWLTNSGWPKRLESIEISNIRGWTGQRIDFLFPIVAVVGENGSGKSTVIQAAAAIYQPPIEHEGYYPTDFFPDTPWENTRDATVKYAIREGSNTKLESIRKLARWRGYHLRPERHVEYIDLSRVQPVSARTGYMRLANPQLKEAEAKSEEWEEKRVKRLSHLMGRTYEKVRMAVTEDDLSRQVPVLQINGKPMSGFHLGAGETTMAELIKKPMKQTSLVLIDEIETSLHPRVQRRVVRELADLCRTLDLQIILTTHSPYILDELPPEARIYIMNESSGRTIVTGVSPEFAMTRMDDYQHPECDVYGEDGRSCELIKAILVGRKPDLFPRCQTVAYGAANVGYALGQMAAQKRFPRPSCVFIDGDQQAREGCTVLPGDDAPERVVFSALLGKNWEGLSQRVDRSFSSVADACGASMSYANHHEWVKLAADRLLLGSDILWHAMCAAWVNACLTPDEAETVIQPISDALAAT